MLGYWPNFDEPKSFSEKLHVRKLQESSRKLIDLSDKLTARNYVTSRAGEHFLVPLLYCGDEITAEQIYDLGDNIVVKRNDDSGSACLIRKNSTTAADAAFKRLMANPDYGRGTNEWWYREIPTKYIVEPLLQDKQQPFKLIDYRFFVFGSDSGEPRILIEVIRRHADQSIECTFFDESLNRINHSGDPVSYRGCKPLVGSFPVRESFPEMKELALKLAEGFNFVRIDMYVVSGKVYFSEITFTPAEGRFGVSPREYDFTLGAHWEQPILLEEKGVAA